MDAVKSAFNLSQDGISINGWKISTVKGPIIADRDSDDFR
jgi:hypothetical protein